MVKGGFYAKLNKSLLWIEGPFWDFVKKYWKISLIIVLAVISFFLYQSNKKKGEDIEFLKEHLDTAFQQMEEWRDVTGELHAVAKKAILQRDQMRLYVDSVAKLLNVKPKQVTEVTKTVTKIEVKEKLKVDTIYIDSSKNEVQYNFSYNDPWINVTGKIQREEGSVHITGWDTLNRVDYWKRKKILGLSIGEKKYFVDFSNTNPHIKTTGFKGVSLSNKPKRFGIGPYIGVTYPIKLQVGIGVHYDIFQF